MKTAWMSAGLALAMVTAVAQDQNKGPMCGGKMREHRAKMMEMHQKLETEWKAQDAELDKLLGDVNSAPAEKKGDALAAVVSKLVEVRKSDHEKFANMRKTMMEHMQAKKQSESTPSAPTSPVPSQ